MVRTRSPLSPAPHIPPLFFLLSLERRNLPAWGPTSLVGSPLLPSLLGSAQLPGRLPAVPTLPPGALPPPPCNRDRACALRSPSAEQLLFSSSAPGPISLPSPPPCPLQHTPSKGHPHPCLHSCLLGTSGGLCCREPPRLQHAHPSMRSVPTAAWLLKLLSRQPSAPLGVPTPNAAILACRWSPLQAASPGRSVAQDPE